MKPITIQNTVGNAYGHVPGHQYHDVTVTITRRPTGRWKVAVTETWGSCQGYNEQHGRREVVGLGKELDDAVNQARERAEASGIEDEYLVQALSQSQAEAEEESETA